MGESQEENKTLTIADIADALGVSKTTVSRAISGKGRIGSETRERVLKYIDAHNYTPNVIAKSLAQNKTYNLAVVMPGDYELIDLPFFQNCIMGIQEIASSFDYDMLLTVCNNADVTKLERIVRNRKVDGVILLRSFMDDVQVEYLQEKNVPFVVTGSSNYKGVVQVDNDHRAACRELTSILLMKRMKKIALIGGNEEHVVTQSRLMGFKDAFADSGLAVDESLIYMNLDNPVLLDGKLDDIIKREVDCIVCMDDAICMEVLYKLRREGISVPDQIRVASFYNSSMLETHDPSITSLDFDAKELGMLVCRTLLDMIEGQKVQKKTLLGYEVRLRESTK
ncbi:MAG: LacI family transcriptional regulator [Lachnospiraceae bacterium]|nr:LacI family transcriptional regulator [Lachnospiraceae bacterium]